MEFTRSPVLIAYSQIGLCEYTILSTWFMLTDGPRHWTQAQCNVCKDHDWYYSTPLGMNRYRAEKTVRQHLKDKHGITECLYDK